MTYRHRTALGGCALVAVCLGTAAFGPGLAAAVLSPHVAAADTPAAPATPPANRVTVNGSGEVQVAPDMAGVTFGVLVDRQSAQDAQAGANIVIANAVRNLHALGIPDRQIQTAGISLDPRYDNAGNVIGYQATQTLSVMVYSLRLVGRVVDAGVAAHANNDVSITYGLRDENAAQTAALKLAVQTARVRAEAAAAVLGRSLAGARVQVTESSQTPPPPRPVFSSTVKAAPGQAAPPTQAFSGTLTVDEEVTLTYTF